MVFTFSGQEHIEYVVIGLGEDSVTLERITCRSQGGNRHGCGYGWFKEGIAKYVRKMRKKELGNYQVSDPLCSLEKGIYIVRNDIDTLLLQPCLKQDEVIKIQKVEWDGNPPGNKTCKLNIFFLQFGKKEQDRISFHDKDKMACVHWFRKNFKKLDIFRM